MMGTSRRELPFAAWALAALLVAPLAAADSVDIRAVAGLPRAGLVDGQAMAWRNVGIVAESDWLDAEVKFASCLPRLPRLERLPIPPVRHARLRLENPPMATWAISSR